MPKGLMRPPKKDTISLTRQKLGDSALLTQIAANGGYTLANLDSEQADLLWNLYQGALDFSKLTEEQRRRHCVSKRTNGYRPEGTAFAGEGDDAQPDANSSFVYWSPQIARRIPYYEEIRALLDRLEAWRQNVAMRIIRQLINEVETYYDHPQKGLTFDEGSVTQFNITDRPSKRKLRQARHEDGTYATVIWPSAKGLEIFIRDSKTPIPLTPDRNQVIVMTGGVLDLMTGGDPKRGIPGEFPPLFHHVRNHHLPSSALSLDDIGRLTNPRIAVACFSCPNPVGDSPIMPYIPTELNQNGKIEEYVINSADMFKLDQFQATGSREIRNSNLQPSS